MINTFVFNTFVFKKIILIISIVMFFILPVFAETDNNGYEPEGEEYTPILAEENEYEPEGDEYAPLFAEADEFDLEEGELEYEELPESYELVLSEDVDYSDIPHSLRNNEYFRESVRLNELAHAAFEFGDYDASVAFAEESIRFANLSDEFVSRELLNEVRRLLDWAESDGLPGRFADDYSRSNEFYAVSLEAHENGNYDTSIIMALNSIAILSHHESGAGTAYAHPLPDSPYGTSAYTPAGALPSQYTVRPWAESRDCFWNIAGYPFIYGDPWRWRVLYEANRSKLPDPNNPNLIEPGMVLDIPSISGEERSGMWRP